MIWINFYDRRRREFYLQEQVVLLEISEKNTIIRAYQSWSARLAASEKSCIPHLFGHNVQLISLLCLKINY
jgi:hypothetical protein